MPEAMVCPLRLKVKFCAMHTLASVVEAVPAFGFPLQALAGVQEKTISGRVVCAPEFAVLVVPQRLPWLSALKVCEPLKDKPVVHAMVGFSINQVPVVLPGSPSHTSIKILSVPFQKNGAGNVKTLEPATAW